MPFWGQAAFGCLSFFVAGFIGLAVVTMAASTMNASGAAMIAVLVIPLGALVAASVFFRVRLGWRGYLPGVLIAFGIVALLVGACFAIIAMSISGSSMR
jgi:hypothetical protein